MPSAVGVIDPQEFVARKAHQVDLARICKRIIGAAGQLENGELMDSLTTLRRLADDIRDWGEALDRRTKSLEAMAAAKEPNDK